MDDFTVFHLIDETKLQYRTQCAVLPNRSIPVAMFATDTLVVIGSPDVVKIDIVRYVEQVAKVRFDEDDIYEALGGRGSVFVAQQFGVTSA